MIIANTEQPIIIRAIPAQAHTMMIITRCLSPDGFNDGSLVLSGSGVMLCGLVPPFVPRLGTENVSE